jgi:hypothetical protein
VEVPYERSKTAAARRKHGVASLDDDEQHPKAPSTALPQRPYVTAGEQRGDLGQYGHHTRSDNTIDDDVQGRIPVRRVSQDAAGLSAVFPVRHSHGTGNEDDQTSEPRNSYNRLKTKTTSSRYDGGYAAEGDTLDLDVTGRNTAGMHSRHGSGLVRGQAATKRQSETSTSRYDASRGKSESKSKS